MLTKNAELLLKKFLNNDFNIPAELVTNTPENLIPKIVIVEQSPLKQTVETELALSELENQGFLKKEAIYIYLTTSGKTYFELKKNTNKEDWKKGFLMPLFSGFTSGVFVTLLTTWLLGLLKFR